LSHRDAVAALIFLGSFHFKAIEGAALYADPDLGQVRTHLPIEAILVHAEETGASRKRIKRGATGTQTSMTIDDLPALCGSGRLRTSCHAM